MNEILKTVLVCDDEPLILEAAGYVIKKEGYQLLTASNGRDALQIARENQPDLILLDVNMPEMTGLEVCQNLKRDNKTKKITIIMFTANVQASDHSKAINFGADDFIEKPFSPKDLRAKLSELFD